MSPSLYFPASRKEIVICCRPKPMVNINISCLTQLLYLVYRSALVFAFLFLRTEGGQISKLKAFVYVSSPQHRSQENKKNSYFFLFYFWGVKCQSQSSLPHSAQCVWIWIYLSEYRKLEMLKGTWEVAEGEVSCLLLSARHNASIHLGKNTQLISFITAVSCPSW